MILVADCSPLIALASCKGLHLLDALFDTVIVPEAVVSVHLPLPMTANFPPRVGYGTL